MTFLHVNRRQWKHKDNHCDVKMILRPFQINRQAPATLNFSKKCTGKNPALSPQNFPNQGCILSKLYIYILRDNS